MNTEAERDKDLPAHTDSRVGQEPDASGQNLSGPSSKTSKRKRCFDFIHKIEDGDRGVCWYWVLVPMVPGTGAFGTGFWLA